MSTALPATLSLSDFAALDEKLEAALLENAALHRENDRLSEKLAAIQLFEVALQAPKVELKQSWLPPMSGWPLQREHYLVYRRGCAWLMSW